MALAGAGRRAGALMRRVWFPDASHRFWARSSTREGEIAAYVVSSVLGITPLVWSCFTVSTAAHVRADTSRESWPAAQSIATEDLWRNFFTNPSLWWDHRWRKTDVSYPDFVHSVTKDTLWTDSWWNPSWVKPRLAALKKTSGLKERAQFLVKPGVSLSIDPARSGKERRLTGHIEVVGRLCIEGRLKEACCALQWIDQQGAEIPTHVLCSIVQGCIQRKDLEVGRLLHALVTRRGLNSSFLNRNIIRMFDSCNCLADANQAFRAVREPDTYSWQAMIFTHINHGQSDEGIKLYLEMRQSNLKPNAYVYAAALKACACVGALTEGRMIHNHIKQTPSEMTVFVMNSVIDMYIKCGSLEEARRVFDNVREKNLVTWNAMIAGFAHHGRGREALQMFCQMQEHGFEPDSITFVGLLNACAAAQDLEKGKQFHSLIVEKGVNGEIVVGNALLDMYLKCGALKEAGQVFDRLENRDVVSWTTMIGGYGSSGHGQDAIKLFVRMEEEGLQPDKVTFLNLLKACGTVGALNLGKRVHALLEARGLESDAVVRSTLLDMYAKCGSPDDAWNVFAKMPDKDLVSWTSAIGWYAQHGNGRKAIQLFQQMLREGLKPDDVTLVCVLSACSHAGLLDEGYRLFCSMSDKFGIVPGMRHYACMVDLLGRAGQINEAKELIERMPMEPEAVVWTSLLGACQKYGNLELGRHAFECLVKLEPSNLAAYVLMSNLYAAVGRWEDEAEVRKKLRSAGVRKVPGKTWIEVRDEVHVFSVNDVDHPQRKQIYEKLDLLMSQMQNSLGVLGDVSMDDVVRRKSEKESLSSALDAAIMSKVQGRGLSTESLHHLLNMCVQQRDMLNGRRIRSLLLELDNGFGVQAGNKLIHLFSRCGSLSEANVTFCRMEERDAYTWLAIIAAHVYHGEGKKAIQLYMDMRLSDFRPNSNVYAAVLRACTGTAALAEGRVIHRHIIQAGLDTDVVVANSLVNMYAKCESLIEARETFDKMQKKSVVSWTTMIAGYAQHGQGWESLRMFREMQEKGLEPNKVTFVSIIKACATLGVLDEGKQVHTQLSRKGYQLDNVVGNALVDMYFKCGSLEEALKVFLSMPNKDVVSWTSLIGGYNQHGRGFESLQWFHHMLESGVRPNKVTFINVLKACSNSGALNQGKEVHSLLAKTEYKSDLAVGSVLVDMYAKYGSLDDAQRVFDQLPHRDLVLWTTLVAGYAQRGHGSRAFQLFQQMQSEGVQPNEIAFLSILKACGSVAALNQGRQFHSELKKCMLKLDGVIGNTLIDMYAKCGSLEEAVLVFDSLSQKDVVSWTVMIAGLAQHGRAQEALVLFERMQQEGLKPNDVTIACILSACSHAGLWTEGHGVFKTMSQRFGISPDIKHYTCLVDLLGRAGHLSEAEALLYELPVQPDVTLWMSLLGACKTQGNTDLGRQCFENIVKLEPANAAAYVLLSEMYIAAGMWEEEAELRRRMVAAKVKKTPGRTWIELNNQVHSFLVEDHNHPERKELYAKLQELASGLTGCT